MANHRSSDAGLLETLADEDETLRAGNRKSSGSHSNEWLVNIADDAVVPMITSEVVEALHAGRLSERSLVWRVGMHDWTPLADVPQLQLVAGPSALPPPASAPASATRKSLSPPEKPRRRVASGVAPARKSKDDSGALAVYNRPTPSLSFEDSVRAEWHGKAPPAPPAPLGPPPPARLTPMPPVTSRLPARVLRAVPTHTASPANTLPATPTFSPSKTLSPASALPPTNTLSPTTVKSEPGAASRPPANPWGDLSVVLASELRAEKKATKRLVLWAAIGSALVASLFTFWVSSRAGSTAPAPATPSQAPQLAAAPNTAAPNAAPINTAPSELLSATSPPPAAVAPPVGRKPAPPVIAVKPRTLPRPKPKLVAPVTDTDGVSAPTSASNAEQSGTAAGTSVAAPDATGSDTVPSSPAASSSVAAPTPVAPTTPALSAAPAPSARVPAVPVPTAPNSSAAPPSSF